MFPSGQKAQRGFLGLQVKCSSSSKEESQAIDLISSVKAEMVVVVLQPFYLFT